MGEGIKVVRIKVGFVLGGKNVWEIELNWEIVVRLGIYVLVEGECIS